MNEDLQARKLSRENSKKATDKILLCVWSGIEPSYLEPPKNAQEVFSAYTRHMGCTYEETLKRASEALLAQWRKETQ